MPELPEVETIRLGLEKYLVGHKIVGIEVKLRKMVTGDTAHVIGGKFTKVERFGKGLVIHLDNGYAIAVHIKLTGQLIYRGPRVSRVPRVSREKVGTLPNKATHVIFNLDRGAKLYYNDFRQFGWIKIVKTDEVEQLAFFRELGPEPPILREGRTLSKVRPFQKAPEVLTLDRFKEIVSKAKTVIKPLLMDQKKIGGIGNIYANEALFVARIDPRRKANSLSVEELEILYEAIIEVMRKGLKYHGASELSFVDALGQEGEYQKHFLVYGQEGEPCPNKNGLIRKFKLGGRGTYVCEKCQK